LTGARPGEPIDVPSEDLPAPLDIIEIRGTDELVEALSSRRSVPSGDDPAARLLQSLIADVDQGAPPLPVRRQAAPSRGSARRGARTVVVLGVTTALLATTGVAAAGGGAGGLGGSLLRSAIVAKQVTALHSRAELRSVCQAVIEGWYGGPGRGTRDRAALPRAARSVTPPARTTGRLRPLRERAGVVRDLLWQGRRGDRPWREWRDRAGSARIRFSLRGARGAQGFARPSSLSITPST
jgi:hypothetical protein